MKLLTIPRVVVYCNARKILKKELTFRVNDDHYGEMIGFYKINDKNNASLYFISNSAFQERERYTFTEEDPGELTELLVEALKPIHLNIGDEVGSGFYKIGLR